MGQRLQNLFHRRRASKRVQEERENKLNNVVGLTGVPAIPYTDSPFDRRSNRNLMPVR